MIYFTKRKKQDRFCVKSKPAIRQRMVSYILRLMPSSFFLFYIGLFLFSFSRQDQSCPQKSNEDRLNIKQKHRPNTNNRFLV